MKPLKNGMKSSKLISLPMLHRLFIRRIDNNGLVFGHGAIILSKDKDAAIKILLSL